MAGHDEDQGGGGHGGGSERWLITYADMITLLMVFFIVLYAMSEVDKARFAAVARGLSAAFGGGNMVIPTAGVGDGTAAPVPGVPDPPKDPLTVLGEQLRADFAQDGRFTVWMDERGLVIRLVGSAAFDSGKADLLPDFLPLLDEIARRVAPLPYDIGVDGHTDSDPINTPEFPSNWYLSSARANRVRDYLEEKGVEASRLIVTGYGETRPLFSNDTAEGKSGNRRVDVIILRDPVTIERGTEITGDEK